MKCSHCQTELKHVFADLQFSPPCQSLITNGDLEKSEVYHPLVAYVCEKCFLVQLGTKIDASAIFNEDYKYFSSVSKSWLNHVEKYVDQIVDRLDLNAGSKVMEIASNDGYLLQYFKKYDIAPLGIEPSTATAEVAERIGIETISEFFGTSFAEELIVDRGKLDLIIGNNVLAHVPDINDFISGMKVALKDSGTITMEFPHLLNLINEHQFDTIYHEHFSYLSFYTVRKMFNYFGLEIYDVDELPTHGGSLRIYACHLDNKNIQTSENVTSLVQKETHAGITDVNFYNGFQEKVDKTKYDLLQFLIEQKSKSKKVVAYGAAGKGNTLLNYCGIKGNDLIEFVADANIHKQGMYLPGSHIPIVSPDVIKKTKPDFVLILPWNLEKEIVSQLDYIKSWGGKFVIPIPELKIIDK